MESDHKNPQPKMSLELGQEESPNKKKKSLWQKIKEFISNALERRASEKGRWENLDDW